MSKLLMACNSLRTSPPPAIANALAKQSNDDLQRCGRITQLLRQSVNEFNQVGKLYGDLYQASFDADPESLDHLQLLKQINSSVSQWIEMVCLRGSLQGSLHNDKTIEFVSNLDKVEADSSIENLVIPSLLVARTSTEETYM